MKAYLQEASAERHVVKNLVRLQCFLSVLSGLSGVWKQQAMRDTETYGFQGRPLVVEKRHQGYGKQTAKDTGNRRCK